MNEATSAPALASADELEKLRRVVGRLDARLEELRSFVLRVMVATAQVLLLLGILLDYVLDDSGRNDRTYSVISAMSAAFSYRNEEGAHSGSDTAIGAAFLLLIVVVLASIFMLSMVWRRRATRRGAGWATKLTVLMLLGVLGAWGMFLISESNMQPALPVLSAGALFAAALVLPARLRAWWQTGL